MKNTRNHIIILVITIVGVLNSFAQHDLNGYWEDNYGMHYYVRQIDNTVYWFGEHNDGVWAGVFKGTLTNNTQRAILGNQPITIRGNIYDLPKGKGQTQADLGLNVLSANEMRKNFGPFSPTVFRKKMKPRNLPGIRSAAYTSDGITGLWKGNDGGIYYMRQIGNNVFWYGEKISGSVVNFSNIAIGAISGNAISIVWADVPKGRNVGNGSLSLKLLGNRITKTSGSGFGGSSWVKINQAEIDVSVFNTIIGGAASKVSLHLNTYAAVGGSPRWYKPNDAYVILPEQWGGKYILNLPEINQIRKTRDFHYYVNDLNSSRYGVTAEVKPKSSINFLLRNRGLIQKQPILQLAIRLETDGTEIIGRCTSCPSSDKGAPDVHISPKGNPDFPIIYVNIPLISSRGKISYGEIETYFDADIQAGGVCKIADGLCEKITKYKEIIRNEIDKGFKASFNDSNVRRNFENSINLIIPAEIQCKVTNVFMEGNKVVVEYN
ncbi:hypothetical protein [Yeosuana marina]|uniref:hypothetical protein n=1 Tax=Yeosuana marina TaxID=1565536 RepID=UPI0030C8C836